MLYLWKLIKRMFVPALLGTFIFLGGYFLGTERKEPLPSFDGPVMGIFNTENTYTAPTVSGGGIAKVCNDESGASVPCLLDRTLITEKADVNADFSQFWKAWNIINEKYVPTKHAAVTNQEKVWGAISGLANSLGDPYTYFLPPQEKTLFEQDVTGLT